MHDNVIRRSVRLIRRKYSNHLQHFTRRRWLKSVTIGGSQLHPSLEFIRGDPCGRVGFGAGCHVERDVTIWISPDEGSDARLNVSEGVYIGRNVYIGVYQPVSIGANSMIGAYSYIISANHKYARRDRPMAHQGFDGKPVSIGEDVWLGTHVVVLPGVTIGRGAIVAAASLVNRDIPEYEIWGGVPARYLKTRPE